MHVISILELIQRKLERWNLEERRRRRERESEATRICETGKHFSSTRIFRAPRSDD